MGKEQLEKAKKILNHIKGYGVYDGNDDIEIFEWLIQQAERVRELENVNRLLKKSSEGSEIAKERLRNWIDELEIENERYREALELLVKQEKLGKDVKTGKTAISHNGMIALKGLGVFNDDNYIVYGVDEIIESVLEELK